MRERGFFGAEQFVISSASSKTAYGLTHCLADAPARKIALTSARNQPFVERLGCYDTTYAYDNLSSIDPRKKTVYIDLASDGALRRRVHEHFGTNLLFDCLVGSTQATDFPDKNESLRGPAPVFFFAALQLDAYKAAGQSRMFMERYVNAERVFLERVARPDASWIDVIEHAGLNDVGAVVAGLYDGTTDPSIGHVFVGT